MRFNKKRGSIEFSSQELIGVIIALILVIAIVELWVHLYGSTLDNSGNIDAASFYSLCFQIEDMLEDSSYNILTEEGFPFYLSSDDPEYILVGFNSNWEDAPMISIHHGGENIRSPPNYPACGNGAACLCLYENKRNKDFDDDDEIPLDCYVFDEDNIYFSGADGWDMYQGNTGSDKNDGANDAYTHDAVNLDFTFTSPNPSITLPLVAYEYLLIYSKGNKAGCKTPDINNPDTECDEEYDEFGVRPMYIEKFVEGDKTHILIATQEGSIQARATIVSALEAQSVNSGYTSGTLVLPSNLQYLSTYTSNIQAILSANPGTSVTERMIYAIIQQESHGDPNMIGAKFLPCCQTGDDPNHCANGCTGSGLYYVDSNNNYIDPQSDTSQRIPQAIGLMQINVNYMDDICGFDVEEVDLYNPEISIRCGINHLETCIQEVQNKGLTPERNHIFACYNGGSGALNPSVEPTCQGQTFWECEINSGYTQTRDYVEKANEYYNSITYSGSSPPYSSGSGVIGNLVSMDSNEIANSCGWYPGGVCQLGSDAYQQLLQAEANAQAAGYNIKVISAYRNSAHQQHLFLTVNHACDRNWVCGPSIGGSSCDITNPLISDLSNFEHCPHATGGAVDIQLFQNGNRLSTTPENRAILEGFMCDAGFVRYEVEHWHFEYGTTRWERGQSAGVCAIV